MPPPSPSRRGRGFAVPLPANRVRTSRRARGRQRLHPSPRHRVLYFAVPVIDGREIISVDSHGLLAAARSSLNDGPVIFVDRDMDGNFYTDYCVPGEPFESLDQLIHAAGVHLLAISIRNLPQSEEEVHVAEPACAQTLQDQESVKDLLNTKTLEELSITATSSSSMQMQAQPWRCLSSLPIWVLARFDWGITFYTRIDQNKYFHTYPHVGGPFQSLEDAHSAIDRYLQKCQDPTMYTKQPGVSRVDRLVRQCINWPDGTRKKLLKSQQDERRDRMRQLVHALVDKYNDYLHLSGDRAYELKDVVRYQSLLRGYGRSRSYYHINFTMKAKGADDSDRDIDDLFFAEITSNRGECIEMVVSCFGMVKSTDNGHCYGCDADVKHPNDAAAYYGGQDSSECACSLFGNMGWTGRNETLEEEEKRVRLFYEAEGLDDPDYEVKASKSTCVDVATTEEVCPVAETPKRKEPFPWGGPSFSTYSSGVGGC